MGLEEDILRNLNKRASSFEEVKKTFPYENLADILLHLEDQQLVKNEEGIWSITEKGKKKLEKGKTRVYNVLVVPAICFFLLSAYFYMGYTGVQEENTQLLQEKAEIEAQLSDAEKEKTDADAEYNTQLSLLDTEKDKTSQLNASYADTEASLNPLQEELDYLICMEQCTPDHFVTVDNAYVKAKVDELIAGLTSLKQKQMAVYEFVRTEIEYDESSFRSGRLDFWEYPETILRRGKGHIEDKFILLLTMLRMAGTPSEHVRFVAAEVDGNDGWGWIEAYDGTTWWVLDPFEEYTFTDNPKEKFYREHRVVILWWFNDEEYKEGD